MPFPLCTLIHSFVVHLLLLAAIDLLHLTHGFSKNKLTLTLFWSMPLHGDDMRDDWRIGCPDRTTINTAQFRLSPLPLTKIPMVMLC